MKTKAIGFFVLAVSAAFVPAQPGASDSKPMGPERGTAVGKFDGGTMTVEYGVPTWNDKFTGEMKEGAVWRLGNNLPTTCVLDCGLMSASGAVTPGTYKLALKYVKEGLVHLLVYQGATFYVEGLPTWEIASESLKKDDAAKQAKLMLAFEGANLKVAFGPYAAVFALKPIKTHPPVETTFANVSAKITALALPLGDAPLKDQKVGVAEVEQNGMKTSWGMFLTVDAGKGTLTFKNPEPVTLPKDKETLGSIVTRIKKMVEEKPEMKEQAASFITMFEKQLSDLDTKEKALGRLAADKSIETTTTKRETPASVLQFSSERPEGKIIFKFGAQGSDAAFEVMPREFQVRRR